MKKKQLKQEWMNESILALQVSDVSVNKGEVPSKAKWFLTQQDWKLEGGPN